MNLPGHVAVAYLLGRRRRAARLGAVVFGALLPDLIDKPLMLTPFTPYGRTVGHSLVFWGYAIALWVVARRWKLPRAPVLGGIVAGGLSHLCADLADDVVEGFQSSGAAFSAWLGWPVTNPDMWTWRVQTVLDVPRGTETTTVLELATVAVCLALAVRHCHR